METKRELNDILINDEEFQKQNRTKKLIMMIAMALIFLSILIAVVFIITREEEDLTEQTIATEGGLTPINKDSDQFVDVPLETNASTEDPFQKILDDIRTRNSGSDAANNTQVASVDKPRTDSKPPVVLPPKDVKPAPVVKPAESKPTPPPANKPATPTTPPAKPAPVVKPTESKPTPPPANKPATPTATAQTNPPATQTNTQPVSITNVFNDISTPTDTSKNGQVAEKGFYIQVGSFANKPSDEFLKKISNYSYRVYAGTSNGQATTKYLIGPYNSRIEAGRDLPKFTTLVTDPVHFEVK
ncbi:SPOR domain-containing protein [Helicobacter sp. MIT 05-5293]|uniref:SPOR domain-containing protein n=1 Tax=Helicobacter sp. MIT 05-5293 TaxID=1548149 RepID=UPI0010FD227F|nr:SPOR domain-containing protein [Helicobacter sp. MIT 05-5293]TLD80545.1 SPOR domain-containing protein [Helicobacter sp. MIT 05-5293]